MIEVYTKKNKRYGSFNTDDIKAVIRRLSQLNILNAIKYFIVSTKGKIHTYWCADCKKRSYFEGEILSSNSIICAHCNTDNRLYFVGFKQSEKQVKYKYAL